jgi:type I restriction enzyme, S subunit
MTFEVFKKKIGDYVEITDYVANGSFATLKNNVQYLDGTSHEKFAVLVRTVDFNRNWNGDYVWVNEPAFHFLKKSSLNQGDLVLCNVGSVGIVFEVPDLGVPMTLGPNSVLCRTKNSNEIRQRFLYYYFQSPAGQALLEELSGGSTVQPKFNKTVLRNSEIEVPDLRHQDFVIEILGRLDSKIAANVALSKTLEEFAQTIFKSWFIDFDPVKAKMAGEKPVGMDEETAALFPDSFIETKVGLIPKGWKVSVLSEVFNIKQGTYVPPNKMQVNSDNENRVPVIGGNGVLGYVNKSTFNFDVPLVTCRGSKCGLLQFAYNPTWISNNAMAIYFKGDLPQPYFTKQLLKTLDFSQVTTGSAQPQITITNLNTLKIVMPSRELIYIFNEMVSAISHNQQSLSSQNQILASIRDALLPKLISGELQKPEEMLAS